MVCRRQARPSTNNEPKLAPVTRKRYAEVWDKHVLPRIGGVALRDLTPQVLDRFTADLRQARVGEATITKALTVLSSMMRQAVTWGRISHNPVAAVTKPKQPRPKRARAVPPRTVEKIRAHLEDEASLRDAVLVSVIAYAGLRPGEALALRWRDVGENVLNVEHSVSDGIIGSTKTGSRRSVRLLAPLADDLSVWRTASDRTEASGLVFPRPDGKPWRETDYRNWRRRVYRDGVKAAGESGLRVYDLRHSYTSLRIYERATEIEIAVEMGNSATMVRERYGHIIDEFANGEIVNAEQAIHDARMFPSGSRDEPDAESL